MVVSSSDNKLPDWGRKNWRSATPDINLEPPVSSLKRLEWGFRLVAVMRGWHPALIGGALRLSLGQPDRVAATRGGGSSQFYESNLDYSYNLRSSIDQYFTMQLDR